MDVVVSYIGYSRWKWLFLNVRKNMIDMNIFVGLFPNLRKLVIFKLSNINLDVLDYLHSYLKGANSGIDYIELHLSKRNHTNLTQLCNIFCNKFANIGLKVFQVPKHSSYGTKFIVIKRHPIFAYFCK